MESKICKACKIELPFCRFNKHSATRDGLRSKCIECRRLEHIEYRRNNPEKMKELQKLCDQRKVSTPESREKKRLRNKQYDSTEAGKLKNKLRAKRWRELNKRKCNSNRSKSKNTWRLQNRDRSNASYALRRASKKNATPPWLTKEDKQEMLELYTICQMFKLYTGQEYHVDHIVPLMNRNICGLHIPCNLRIIPAFENLSKNNKFDESLAIDYLAEAYR